MTDDLTAESLLRGLRADIDRLQRLRSEEGERFAERKRTIHAVAQQAWNEHGYYVLREIADDFGLDPLRHERSACSMIYVAQPLYGRVALPVLQRGIGGLAASSDADVYCSTVDYSFAVVPVTVSADVMTDTMEECVCSDAASQFVNDGSLYSRLAISGHTIIARGMPPFVSGSRRMHCDSDRCENGTTATFKHFGPGLSFEALVKPESESASSTTTSNNFPLG